MRGIVLVIATFALANTSHADSAGKYANTGMSVTGPASEKKVVNTAASTRGTADDKTNPAAASKSDTANSHGMSNEESNGINSATTNSH